MSMTKVMKYTSAIIDWISSSNNFRQYQKPLLCKERLLSLPFTSFRQDGSTRTWILSSSELGFTVTLNGIQEIF